MSVGELIDLGTEAPEVSGDAMRWKPGSVLDLIDSALADCTSDDAMRWAPDVPLSSPGHAPATEDVVELTLAGRAFVAHRPAGQWQYRILRCVITEPDGRQHVIDGAALRKLWRLSDPKVRARLRRMHSSYSCRSRRRNRRDR